MNDVRIFKRQSLLYKTRFWQSSCFALTYNSCLSVCFILSYFATKYGCLSNLWGLVGNMLKRTTNYSTFVLEGEWHLLLFITCKHYYGKHKVQSSDVAWRADSDLSLLLLFGWIFQKIMSAIWFVSRFWAKYLLHCSTAIGDFCIVWLTDSFSIPHFKLQTKCDNKNVENI